MFFFFLVFLFYIFFFFFFQAEDGIRDLYVTGVQTCALPIFRRRRPPARRAHEGLSATVFRPGCAAAPRPRRTGSGACSWPTGVCTGRADRSEERRVGKECRSRGSPSHEKKTDRGGGWGGENG